VEKEEVIVTEEDMVAGVDVLNAYIAKE